jgi:DNA-directed RNA polymerase specialized sigma24 family protein
MASIPEPFPSTMWRNIEAAKHPDEAGYVDAVNRFTTAYWKPVFYFLRARGYSVAQAEDLTQEFFLTFLERRWLQPADPRRGRFRNFLLTILCRFVSDRGPERSTRQSQFEQRLVPISALVREEDRSFEPASGETAEQIFMRQWAEAVIAAVVRQLEAWCQQKGRPDWYRIFSAAYLQNGSVRPSQESLAEQSGVSRDQVRYALEQVKSQFIFLMREEVCGQGDSDADAQREILELESFLAR